MTTLEKILQEIEHAIDENMECIYDEDGGTRFVLDSEFARFITKDIIKKHLSDNYGWIPVEDKLPKESGYYLVNLSRKLPNEDYSNMVVALYNELDKEFMSYSNLIIAWQPLPEPYRKDSETMRNCNTCIYYDNRGFCTVHYTIPGGCKDYSPDHAEKELIDLQEYRKLGTVEEVREAVEKTKAKKPKFYSTNWYCSICGNLVGNSEFHWLHDFCEKCGNKIDWSVE